MQFSSTCFWSALVSVEWSVPRNLQFLFTDAILQPGGSLPLSTSPFPATVPRPWSVTSALHATWAQMRWSCRSLAPIPRFATAATQGAWTSQRTLERCIQEGAFLLHQNRLSEAASDWLQGSCRARASFLCRTRLQSPPPAPAEPPR